MRAASPALKTPRAVKTGADGRYVIDDLPAGRYVVSAVKTNYVTAAFGQSRPLGPGVRFNLEARQVAADINFALVHTGAIVGRIVDENGDPMSDVQVRSMRYQYVNGERRMAPTPGFASTNDLGDFRLFGLPPGEYYVAASFPMYVNGTDTPTGDRSGYAPTYYPGTGNAADAQRISIAAGQVASGLTMVVLPVRTSRVSGIVLNASGEPLKNGFVNATARIGLMGFGGTGAPVGADGRFTIAGLTPGDYLLRVGPVSGNSAVLPITVGDGDLTDVQLAPVPPSTLTGRVIFDSDINQPPARTIRVSAQRGDPMLNFGVPPFGGSVKEDYTFEVKVMSGRALIRASQPAPGWRFKRAILRGQDVTDTPVDIPQNGRLSDIVIEFTNKLNEVSATVTDVVDAARDVWVVLFAQDARKWTPPSRWVAASRADGDGHIRIQLMAGDYGAIAVDDVELGEWTDPEYLARVRDRAVKFSIADGESKSLELKLSSSR